MENTGEGSEGKKGKICKGKNRTEKIVCRTGGAR